MAIYTRFGIKVEIVWADLERSRCIVKYLDWPRHHGETRRVELGDLKADGGLKEVIARCKEVKGSIAERPQTHA
jgi:hypothetical protein